MRNQTRENNHNWKGGQYLIGGRKVILFPNSSRAFYNGYVQEHILLVEKALGKPLAPTVVVHHVNGDKTDNENCNLVACQDENYHRLLHKRMRAYKACGNPNWIKCTVCKVYDDPKNLYIRPKDGIGYHRECRNIRTQINRLKNKLKQRRLKNEYNITGNPKSQYD